uniref:Uncharacterized protein n=1 Tax=Anguilla anguilla TaxID=7936 RepID=A0A0E9RT86_ANGAN
MKALQAPGDQVGSDSFGGTRQSDTPPSHANNYLHTCL